MAGQGAIAARFTIDDSSVCFINCHLAAGQKHVRERNTDITAILEDKSVFPVVDDPEIAYVGGGDGSMILDHELCFVGACYVLASQLTRLTSSFAAERRSQL